MNIPNYRSIIIDSIKPFSLSPERIIEYLKGLNNLPLYDIELNLFETSLLFRDQKDSMPFNDLEKNAIEEFMDLAETLPSEDSDFWSDNSLMSKEWEAVRRSADCVLKVLLPAAL